MSNIFADIQNAFASTTGLDVTVSGFLLGACLIVALFVILYWVMGDGEGKMSFMFSAGFGVTLAGVVGWFPTWSIIFIGIFILFAIIDPLGGRASG